MEGELNSRQPQNEINASSSLCNQRFPNCTNFRTSPSQFPENCYEIKFAGNLIELRVQDAKQFLTYNETFLYRELIFPSPPETKQRREFSVELNCQKRDSNTRSRFVIRNLRAGLPPNESLLFFLFFFCRR